MPDACSLILRFKVPLLDAPGQCAVPAPHQLSDQDKSPVSGPRLILTLAGIRQIVVHIKAIEKDELMRVSPDNLTSNKLAKKEFLSTKFIPQFDDTV